MKKEYSILGDLTALSDVTANHVYTLQAGEYTGIYVYKRAYKSTDPLLKLKASERKIGQFSFTLSVQATFTQHELQKLAYNQRVIDQVGTAGTPIKMVMAFVAKDHASNDFTDHKVHELLRREGYAPVQYTVFRNREWFDAPDDVIERVIMQIITGNQVRKATQHSTKIILRDEQKEAANQARREYRKAVRKNEVGQMIWNCKMRFGKTLTAYDFLKKIDAKNALVITHRPSTATSWGEDIRKIYGDSAQFITRQPIDGIHTTAWDDRDEEKTTVVFLSLQDARQQENTVDDDTVVVDEEEIAEQVFHLKQRNADIFNTLHFDAVIVDESHEGTETVLAQNVFDAISTDFKLFLSGTDFRRIQDDTFHKNEIYNWTYIDEQRAKRMFALENPGQENPYGLLPEVQFIGIDIQQDAKDLDEHGVVDENNSFTLRKYFEIDGNSFDAANLHKARFTDVAEKRIKQMLNRFAGIATEFDERSADTDTSAFAPYSSQMAHLNRHSMIRVDSVATAYALESVFNNHRFYGEYKVINVADNIRHNSGGRFSDSEAEQWVKEEITDKPWETKTITITVGRLTVGTSVPAWSAIIFLSDTKSPASYLQTAFRAQTPCREFDVTETREPIFKDSCRVYDVVPNRQLEMLTESVAPGAHNGSPGDQVEAGEKLVEFLQYAPVMAFRGNQFVKMDTEDFMKTLYAEYALETVRDQFITSRLYNLGAEVNEDLAKILTAIANAWGLTTKQNGNRKRKTLINGTNISSEKERIIKSKPRKERTEEEEKLLKEQRDNRNKVVGTLNTLSARVPLLAAFNYTRFKHGEIVPENFATLVDDESWKEFMPTGFTKEMWEQIKELYNREVFRQAVEQITRRVEHIQSLGVDDRLLAMRGLFTLFADPDKETVLTPSRVVDLQLSQAFGGLRTVGEDGKSYVRRITDPKGGVFTEEYMIAEADPELEFAPQWLGVSDALLSAGETEDFWLKDNTFLELNSKTALYPLYMTHSSYYARKMNQEEELGRELTELEKEEILKDVVENQIFANTRVPYSRRIFEAVISGDRENIETNSSVVDIANVYSRVRKYARKKGKFDRELADKVLQYIFNLETYLYDTVQEHAEQVMTIESTAELKELVSGVDRNHGMFNAVVGNPPYQASSNRDNGTSAFSVYHNFMLTAQAVSDYTSLVYPARWLTGGQGEGLDEFREDELNSENYIKFVLDPRSDFFENVELKGGVNYFLWKNNRSGKTQYIYGNENPEQRKTLLNKKKSFIRESKFSEITEKIDTDKAIPIIGVQYYGRELTSETKLKRFAENIQENTKTIEIYYSISGGGVYKLGVPASETTKKTDDYKVLLSKTADPTGNSLRRPGRIFIAEPGEICSSSFIGVVGLKSQITAEHALKYLKTDFAMFLLGIITPTQDASSKVYRLIPGIDFNTGEIYDKPGTFLDFNGNSDDLDDQLAEIYGFTDEEREIISNNIRPWKDKNSLTADGLY